MNRFSLSLKLSSTAFLTHWLTVHSPTPRRSATRISPASRLAITLSTAARTSGLLAGSSEARPSQARSMVLCSDEFMSMFDGDRIVGSGHARERWPQRRGAALLSRSRSHARRSVERQHDRERRRPAVLPVLGDHVGRDAAAHVPPRDDAHTPR